MLKKIQKSWKEISSSTLYRKDLEEYIKYAKAYVQGKTPGHTRHGICYYIDEYTGGCGGKSAYSIWNALSEIPGTVAARWQRLRDIGAHGGGGRTPQRIAMTKALIEELEPILLKDKARKRRKEKNV